MGIDGIVFEGPPVAAWVPSLAAFDAPWSESCRVMCDVWQQSCYTIHSICMRRINRTEAWKCMSYTSTALACFEYIGRCLRNWSSVIIVGATSKGRSHRWSVSAHSAHDIDGGKFVLRHTPESERNPEKSPAPRKRSIARFVFPSPGTSESSAFDVTGLRGLVTAGTGL
ncbi:unnamed protein product, partial [Iphiclides podalirius]